MSDEEKIDIALAELNKRAIYLEGRHEGIYSSYDRHKDEQGIVHDSLKPIDILQVELKAIEQSLSQQDDEVDRLKARGRKFGKSFVIRVLSNPDQNARGMTLYEGMPPYRTPDHILSYHRYATAGHAYGLLYAIEECLGVPDCVAAKLEETESRLAAHHKGGMAQGTSSRTHREGFLVGLAEALNIIDRVSRGEEPPPIEGEN